MTATEERPDIAVSAPPARRRWIRWPLAALSGVLAAAVTLGIAQLVAVLVGPNSAPVLAVGSAAIDRTPPQLKQFAVDHFGTNDKLVLISGIVVVLALFAVALGLIGLRRRLIGVGGVVVLGIVGALAAVTRPVANPAYILPSIIGAAFGVLALLALLARIGASTTSTSLPGSAVAPAGPDNVPTDDQTDFADYREANATGPDTADGDRSLAARMLTTAGRKGVDRRGFLIAGGTTAVAAAVTGGAGKLLLDKKYDVGASRASISLPAPASPAQAIPAGADLKIPNLSPFVTSNKDFYRVDTALTVPQLSAKDWSLKIHGMVDNETTINFSDLLNRDLIERTITMTCVSNEVGGPYISTAKFLGVPLAPLLKEIGVKSGSDQIVTTSVDGWTAGTPVDVVMDGRDAMLAIGMNGQPLPLEHGFPVRMVVPGLYGFVSACKWMVDMELTTFSDVKTYWRKRGWGTKAPIKTESRIDTPKPFANVGEGTIPIAGIAWAQRKGIAKVEVSIDNGPWQTCKLAEQDTVDTWRQWVFQWKATKGNHNVRVRATDKTGYTQTDARANPIPDGATGWASTSFTVT